MLAWSFTWENAMNAKILTALALAAGWTSAAHAGHSVAACKEYAQNAVNQFHTLDAAGCPAGRLPGPDDRP